MIIQKLIVYEMFNISYQYVPEQDIKYFVNYS